MISYALDKFDNKTNNLTIFGIAKDGHIIYGPYTGNRHEFTCSKLDICNGY
jgi:hypothetical protein